MYLFIRCGTRECSDSLHQGQLTTLSLHSPVWRLWLLRLRRLLLGAAYHLRGTLMHIGEYYFQVEAEIQKTSIQYDELKRKQSQKA